MQKVVLLCIGAIKTSWITEGCNQYSDRLQHDLQLELVEIPASKERDPDRQMQEESERLLEALSKREGEIFVLDERGKEMSSEEFSTVLAGATDQGRSLLFVLGGAYGLSDAVRERADRILRLSAMTLPHELCRVVFLEQLYRAVQIQKGSGYHH